MRQESEVGQEARSSNLVQSVERALRMLEETAAGGTPPSASEIARGAGVNRGTAWRLLATLEHFQMVERDPHSGRYTVGYGPTRLAAASGTAPLVRRARPVLERLGARLEESVYLQVMSGYTAVVLDEVPGTRPVRVDLPKLEVPLHCGSVGKLFLAFLPEREREEFLAAPLETYTPRTVADPGALRAELAAAGSARLAVAYKEHLPDWGGATSVACDRRGRPLAYLNVTVPAYRYTEAQLRALGAPLVQAATELEALLLPAVPSAPGSP